MREQWQKPAGLILALLAILSWLIAVKRGLLGLIGALTHILSPLSWSILLNVFQVLVLVIVGWFLLRSRRKEAKIRKMLERPYAYSGAFWWVFLESGGTTSRFIMDGPFCQNCFTLLEAIPNRFRCPNENCLKEVPTVGTLEEVKNRLDLDLVGKLVRKEIVFKPVPEIPKDIDSAIDKGHKDGEALAKSGPPVQQIFPGPQFTYDGVDWVPVLYFSGDVTTSKIDIFGQPLCPAPCSTPLQFFGDWKGHCPTESCKKIHHLSRPLEVVRESARLSAIAANGKGDLIFPGKEDFRGVLRKG